MKSNFVGWEKSYEKNWDKIFNKPKKEKFFIWLNTKLYNMFIKENKDPKK